MAVGPFDLCTAIILMIRDEALTQHRPTGVIGVTSAD